MTELSQPEDSLLCGQTCVAMAADVSLGRSIEVFGHSKATTTKEVVTALRAFGIRCADRLKRVAKNRVLPARAILHIRCRLSSSEPSVIRYWGHWMLYWDGKLHDPGNAYPDGYNSRWQIVSYLEIYS